MAETGWRPRVAYLRARLHIGWARVRGAVLPNTESAIFATIAYLIGRYVLGQPTPIFAAISCYLCLGFSRNRQPRKVIEIGLGATFGVLLGELIGRYLGFDWWQLLLILLVAPLWARLIDNSDLMTFQTAINAIVVAALSISAGVDAETGSIGRWVVALVGALVALVATAILPTSLVTRPRRYASTSMVQLADALEALAVGLRTGDVERAAAGTVHLNVALEQIREGEATRESAADHSRINPRLRSVRDELSELRRTFELLRRAHGSTAMLARQARAFAVESGRSATVARHVEDASVAVRHLALSVRHWSKPVLARTEAETLAARLAPDRLGQVDWRSTTVIALLRSLVVDVLQMCGLSTTQARSHLPDTGLWRSDDPSGGLGLPSSGGSDLWGTGELPAIVDDDDREDGSRNQSTAGS